MVHRRHRGAKEGTRLFSVTTDTFTRSRESPYRHVPMRALTLVRWKLHPFVVSILIYIKDFAKAFLPVLLERTDAGGTEAAHVQY